MVAYTLCKYVRFKKKKKKSNIEVLNKIRAEFLTLFIDKYFPQKVTITRLQKIRVDSFGVVNSPSTNAEVKQMEKEFRIESLVCKLRAE